MKVGCQIKLSQEGLDFIYKYDSKGKERARQFRYEYRGVTKADPDIVIAKRLTSESYVHYLHTFIEPVED